MCGILGAIDFRKGLEQTTPALDRGLKAIEHRGPDGSKAIHLQNVYLGHNRLSIIDLSKEADQPMKSRSADAYIIFNGEIYNYKELKNNLSGVSFFTKSDSEVLLEGYLNEGIGFFGKLRGIYAFAIYDNRDEQKIIIARDPSGVKPLYYYSGNGLYLFGSEIKALLPAVRDKVTINQDVLKSYLNLGYCCEPYTIYNEISCLPPGSMKEIKADGPVNKNFRDYDFETENRFDLRYNTEQTKERLYKAVERNLVADVEVAVALSGGIDSSLIYAFANRSNADIKGLTVKFDDEEYNEGDISKIYADTLKGKHAFVEVESELNLETLNKILINFDQPYADSSAINVYYLTKATKSITKVLIGGDGGDELYNGYPSMTWLTYVDRLNRNSMTRKGGKALLSFASILSNPAQIRSLKRISDLWSDKPFELLYDWHSWLPRKTMHEGGSPFLFDTSAGVDFYKTLFKESAPERFKSLVVFDYFRKQMLSDYLRKTDMMSMINGVEYRVPLLDEDLTDFALTIPFDQKSTLRESKKILRNIHRKIYPSHTSRISKKGFTIPLDSSLSKDDFNIIKEDLMTKNNFLSEYIVPEYTAFLFRALEDRPAAEADISRAGIYQRILMLYSLSLWHKNK